MIVYFSDVTVLRRMPIPLDSTSTTSPGLSQRGGSKRAPAPVGVPVAETFRYYHLLHHVHQGEDGTDTDLPTELEARALRGPVRKLAQWESAVDKQIREAQERGEFDNLPGQGKPLAKIVAEQTDVWSFLCSQLGVAVEDALKAHQRPKLERYEGSLFLVLKTLWYVDSEDAVETGEINLFVGPDFVVSVRHGKGIELHSARLDLEKNTGVLGHGPSAVVYTICDRVVDSYEEVEHGLEADVDEVEASVFSPDRTRDSQRIYVLKRELAEMRRAVRTSSSVTSSRYWACGLRAPLRWALTATAAKSRSVAPERSMYARARAA